MVVHKNRQGHWNTSKEVDGLHIDVGIHHTRGNQKWKGTNQGTRFSVLNKETEDLEANILENYGDNIGPNLEFDNTKLVHGSNKINWQNEGNESSRNHNNWRVDFQPPTKENFVIGAKDGDDDIRRRRNIRNFSNQHETGSKNDARTLEDANMDVGLNDFTFRAGLDKNDTKDTNMDEPSSNGEMDLMGDQDVLAPPSVKKTNPYLWKTLCGIWPKVLSGILWTLGDENSVNFLIDPWVSGEGPLLSNALQVIDEDDQHESVNQFVNNQGNWDMDRLKQFLPHHVCQKIDALLPPCMDRGKDCLSWGSSNHGHFTIKEAYNFIARDNWDARNSLWI
ncbi:Ribonuclease H [Quillaja saponaria]|uniref:Ribonuclease H n=1 Tax=Quillaja saponaria TaxID=32244 RepID=A0AAD7QJP3_QUISA|nr:Ribonuclease H [Quillaja saponaria]